MNCSSFSGRWLIGAFGLFLMTVLLSLGACQKEEFSESEDVKISFSTDTLRFDTVFTERGTITRFFKVFNGESQSIRLNNVYLEGSTESFRYNVDGFDQSNLGDVVIRARDSIYVFVEATIDPDAPVSASPFLIHDKLMFEVNGQISEVQLEAFGQNANYIPAKDARGGVVLLSCDGGTVHWDDPRPYVVFGALVIDDCTLVLPAGARLHVHGGIAEDNGQIYNDGLIFVAENGRLLSEGTAGNPVKIQGDRLEQGFAETRGQWAGIRLGANSGPHHFQYTEIRNSIVGLRADSATDVSLEQVRILNTSGPGLVGVHNSIHAVNLLIGNNGGHSIQLTYGGDHHFYYTTLANFGNQIEALRMDNVFCFDPPDCTDVRINPLNATFTNSIIAGSGRDQILIIDPAMDQGGSMNFTFDHCLVRVFQILREDRYSEFMDDCNNCYNFELFEPVFVDVQEGDYRLDSISLARGFAKPIPEVTTIDLTGGGRSSDEPDAGAFEWKNQ